MTAQLGPSNGHRLTAAPLPVRSEAEAAERFRLLIESVNDYAIFILDPAGQISTWNPGAERIKGYQASEILGKHFSIFYPAEVAASGRCDEELVIAAREGRFEEEGWRLRKDGSPLWAKVTITALRDADQQLVGFAKVTQDLTARRAAEEETRRFRLLVESVKDYAIFILDPTGHVSSWNPGAERIKGYTADEIIGRHFSNFYPAEDAAEGKCELELKVAVEDGRFEEEGWRVRKDGSRFWANVTITPLRDPDGSLLGFAKVTQDLTQRREAEEGRRALAAHSAALAEKVRTQEFQERFLAILGHDLRNPLAALDMGAAILNDQVKDPGALRIIERIRSSSSRMSRMVEQILDLTRSRLADGLEMAPQTMDLRLILNNIVDEMRTAYPERMIALDCPQLVGSWDPDRLEQVFSNLIGNAILHGDPSTPVSIRANVVDRAARITVHNGGPPIAAEIQPVLFNPFRRGERDSRTSKTAGLGLGLYISHEIVRGHGGSIHAESSVGHGTTFEVSLPLTEASESR